MPNKHNLPYNNSKWLLKLPFNRLKRQNLLSKKPRKQGSLKKNKIKLIEKMQNTQLCKRPRKRQKLLQR